MALHETRGLFAAAAAFSLFANLLVLTLPLYMLQVLDRVLTTGHIETLLLLSLIAASAFLVAGALDVARNTMLSRIGHWVEARVAPDLIDKCIRSRLYGESTGAQLLRELSRVRSFISGNGIGTFFDAPWTPVFLGILFILHPWLGWLGVGAAVILLGLALATELLTRAPFTAASSAGISAMGNVEAAVRNAEVVLAMGMRDALTARWQTFFRAASSANEAGSEYVAWLTAITKTVRMLAQMAVLGLGAYLVVRQELTAGAMIAGSIVLARGLAPVEQAMSGWRAFAAARLAQERINSRLESFPEEEMRTRLPEPTGELDVEHLSYTPRPTSRTGRRRPVLEDVSFHLRPGEAMAVIGPSAAGKSTLCRILIGIQQPSEGKVRLDRAELRVWDSQDLGRYIGYLPQDVELFSGSVRENIARLREDADDADIVAAAKQGHAHDMILQLSDGYETQIGDGGTRLSGGQRQRIGLARALFGDPKLIVLDEPNANLDQDGESALAAAIGDLKARGATIVIVGHRPSTLHQVDKVMVLKEGRVAALGPRESVLSDLRSPKEHRSPEAAPAAVGGQS